MIHQMRAICVVCALLVGVLPAQSQTSTASAPQLKNLLQRYKNWRYGMISLYKVSEADESITNLNMVLGPREPELPEEAKACKKRDEVENIVLTGGEGMDPKEIEAILRAPGCRAYERYYSQRVAWERAQFKKAYVVTQRVAPGETPRVIALLTQKTSESYYGVKEDLDPPSEIFIENDLQKDLNDQVLVGGVVKKAKEVLGTSASSLYEFLANQIVQGNMENVTPEAQGIGDENTRLVSRKYGNTTPLTEDDVQMYVRISEGLPQDYTGNNEIIASLVDGISYRRYENKINPDEAVDSTALPITNGQLPKYGVELRYGLDDLNYPGLWSERMALNAIWGSTRLGVVLPTNGWSSLASDFGATRTMTHAGFGLNGSFDFPIRVVSKSGVFNVSASYVFDDANQTNHQTFNADRLEFVDNLVRFHASVAYTFAVRIDNDFMFRFRLGGTVYNMEQWAEQEVFEFPDSVRTEYVKSTAETIGGVSGRIEFMTTGWSTPVGFTLSYFDDTILSLAWLQVPVMPQFAVRFDARIFTPVFREARLWEQNSVVMPSVRLVFNF